jgi:hypothetical protein
MKTKTLQTYHSYLLSGKHPIRLDTESFFPQQYSEPAVKIDCDAHFGDAVWKDRRVVQRPVKEIKPPLGEVAPDPVFGGECMSWQMYDWLDQLREEKGKL